MRVRAELFTISNIDGTIVLPAELMMGSGAETKLRLPGRKVVQLWLIHSGYVTRQEALQTMVSVR